MYYILYLIILILEGKGEILCISLIRVIYPAICRAVRPPLKNSAKAKKLGGG